MKPNSTVAVRMLGMRCISRAVDTSQRKTLIEQSALNGNILSLQKRLDNHSKNGGREILPVWIAKGNPSKVVTVLGKCLRNFGTWKPTSTTCSLPLARLIGYVPTIPWK